MDFAKKNDNEKLVDNPFDIADDRHKSGSVVSVDLNINANEAYKPLIT